jgi:hypothetical protein
MIPLQMGAEPLLQSVFADLFDEAGHEVYLRRPAQFGLSEGQQYSWAQLQDAARTQGDLLMGYVSRWESACVV